MLSLSTLPANTASSTTPSTTIDNDGLFKKHLLDLYKYCDSVLDINLRQKQLQTQDQELHAHKQLESPSSMDDTLQDQELQPKEKAQSTLSDDNVFIPKRGCLYSHFRLALMVFDLFIPVDSKEQEKQLDFLLNAQKDHQIVEIAVSWMLEATVYFWERFEATINKVQEVLTSNDAKQLVLLGGSKRVNNSDYANGNDKQVDMHGNFLGNKPPKLDDDEYTTTLSYIQLHKHIAEL